MNTLELFERYKIIKPIRLIELFAGYGSQALALENLGVKFEHHQVVEFDKYAIKSYNALHGTNYDTQDITKLDKLNITETEKYDYIVTYSFPCTDLSLAGKGLGMKQGTRSGLLWEVERLLLNTKELPQVLVMENVTQVHGTKHKEDFDEWITFLAKLGYSNQWKDLNAKHYGIPQSRDRTFMVSILGDYEYQFPNPIELKLRLKDMLEDNVSESYYLSEKAIQGMLNTTYETSKMEYRVQEQDGISATLCARDYKDPKCVVVGNLQLSSHEQTNRVYSSKGLSPTLNTMQGGNRQPKILIPEDTKKGYKEAYEGDGVYIDRPHQKRGVVQSQMIQTIKTSGDDIGVVIGSTQKNAYVGTENEPSPTLTSAMGQGGGHIPMLKKHLAIRKLTPFECLRLMGFNDNQVERIKTSENSNSQLYKQAGNSIVVQVLEAIFKELL